MTGSSGVAVSPIQPFSDVLLVRPEAHRDERGHFLETWRKARYRALGVDARFVQDNHSRSHRHVLRGMHFQYPHAQGKLVWVSNGEAHDVVVDIRRGSPTFGDWGSVRLTDADHEQVWVPEGFAHGFLALTETVDLHYKCTAYYAPEDEHVLLWNDDEVGIEWPIDEPRLSKKDRDGRRLAGLRREDLLPECTED